MKTAHTYGLSHIAIAVSDLDRTLAFYKNVFDVEVMYHKENFLQVTTRALTISSSLKRKKADYGHTGGIAHFGFRLRNAKDIDEMAARVSQAGGTIMHQGEFVPGEPYIFFKDPDGYEVEIAYELTPD